MTVALVACLASSRTLVDAQQAATPTTVLVASRELGIVEVDASSAAVVRTITATHASIARRRDSTHAVFLVEGTNELREVDLTSGVERTIATLPGDVGLGCGGQWGSSAAGEAPHPPYVVSDALWFSTSMAVDADHACFEVMDRNLNMASVVAQIEVDLRTSAIRSWITWVLADEPSSCIALAEAEETALPCTQLLRRRSREAGTAGRARTGHWTVREGAGEQSMGLLVPPTGRARRLAVREPHIETISPDGRWAVIGGNREEGDYIHRSLWMLDLTSGRLFGHGDDDDDDTRTPTPAVRGWPAPIAPRELADPRRMERGAFGASGETSVRWRGRTLVLGDQVIVTPGRSIVRLPGPIVW